jgi:hypothetical protein
MQDISMFCVTPAYNKINIRIVVAHRSDRMKIEKSKKKMQRTEGKIR